MEAINDAIAKLAPELRSEWSELHPEHRDPADTLGSWRPEHRLAVRTALADYASSQTDARDVVENIGCWSCKIGAALTCVVAREALKHALEGDSRPQLAIDTAERWVRGEATTEECGEACRLAAESAASALSSADWSSIDTSALFSYTQQTPEFGANVPFHTACAATSAGNAAFCVGYAVSNLGDAEPTNDARTTCASGFANATEHSANAAVRKNQGQSLDDELQRLCQVIAEALRTGSVGEWIG